MLTTPRAGSVIAKTVIAVVLAAISGAAYLWMTQEQQARAVSQEIYEVLADGIEDHLTVDDVHERLGRQPNAIRTPFKNRLVEEYTLKGPFESHTVYAYYTVAATKILEAASIDQQLDEWESQ